MSACDQHRVIHDKYSRENININVTPDNIPGSNSSVNFARGNYFF